MDYNRLLDCLARWAADRHTYALLADLNTKVLVPLCALGALVNLVALCLLHRPPRIKSGVFIYLNALLVTNALHLVSAGTRALPYLCDAPITTPEHWLRPVCIRYHQWGMSAQPRLVALVNTVHMWLIAALAVHRAWKTKRPFEARMMDTNGRAACTLLLVLFGAILFRVPMLFELRFVSVPMGPSADGVVNHQLVLRENEALAASRVYNIAYYLVANTFLYHLGPFVLMTVGCAITMQTLRHPNWTTRRGTLVLGEEKNDVLQVPEQNGSPRKFSSANRSVNRLASAITRTIDSTNGIFTRVWHSGGDSRRPRLRRALKALRSDNSSHNSSQQSCVRRREHRATLSIVAIILTYTVFHLLSLYETVRRWQMTLWHDSCLHRWDYVLSEAGVLLSAMSSCLNAFIFIAVTNRVKRYLVPVPDPVKKPVKVCNCPLAGWRQRSSRMSSARSSFRTQRSPVRREFTAAANMSKQNGMRVAKSSVALVHDCSDGNHKASNLKGSGTAPRREVVRKQLSVKISECEVTSNNGKVLTRIGSQYAIGTCDDEL